MATHEDYRQAATLLWGDAGDLAAAETERLGREHFAGRIPPMPVIIGLTAYGRCLGLTRGMEDWLAEPRITLAPELFNGNHRTPGGARTVADVIVHELVHVALMLRGEDPRHNFAPWCQMITDLSPAVLGSTIDARPVVPRRVPNPDRETNPKAPKTIVVRRAEPGTMSQAELATWPQCRRPVGYYDGDKLIPVPTY